MNDARRRRKDLQKRIFEMQKSQAYQAFKFVEWAQEHAEEPEPERNTIHALVFLKSAPSWVHVDLPRDNPTAAIDQMRKHGFWGEMGDCPTYVPGDEIAQISIVK